MRPKADVCSARHVKGLNSSTPHKSAPGFFRRDSCVAHFSFFAPSVGEPGLAFFCWLSLVVERGVGELVMPAPVVLPRGAIVPRSGVAFVFPVSDAVDGSVGEGVVALTPGPD